MPRPTSSTVRLTQPAIEPVQVRHVTSNSNIDHTEDDNYIAEQIVAAAREYVEDEAGKALVTTAWRQSFDAFPAVIYLDRPPVQSVDEVRYIDSDGVEQVLAASKYRVDYDSQPARITPALNESWPATAAVTRALQITFTAGYGNPFTADAGANTIIPQNGVYRNGDLVQLRKVAGPLPGGLLEQGYFVVGATSSTIQLATTIGGSAIDITSAGSGKHLIGDIPAGYKRAIVMLASYWYETREAFVEKVIERDRALSLANLIANTGRIVSYA